MSNHVEALTPVGAGERIETLDVLRGLAVLGILVMNIQSYSQPGAAYFFPTAYGDFTGINYWLWYLSEIFFRRKFITIFSMLFGAGIVLMNERAQARSRKWAGLHYRRMGVLWLIGMCHAYLLWDGDILVSYAICGLFVYLFRNLRPRRLVIAGLVFLIVASGLSLLAGYSTRYWPEESLTRFNEQWLPGPDDLNREIVAMRGDYAGEIAHRAQGVFMIHVFFLPFQVLWRAAGCMLLGMALFNWGVFSGRCSRRTYGWLTAIGLAVGLPLTALAVQLMLASDWDPATCFFTASQFAYWGSLPLALGFVGLVMLLLRAKVRLNLAQRLGAVGRMAFTNYLMHTIVCTTLFYGRGLGLFGRVDRTGMAAIVLAIWVLQLVYSPIWLRRFRFGPAEWLWRSLSYRHWQPMRRLDKP